MRLVVQRASRASVVVEGKEVGSIGRGIVVFLGVGSGDEEADAEWLAGRLARLRIFGDADGKMNQSLVDIGGEAMVISQFTLFGNLKKGNRPSFNRAAPPETAVPLYEKFVELLSAELGKPVPSGVFGAHMDLKIHNDGPVTLVVDSRERDF